MAKIENQRISKFLNKIALIILLFTLNHCLYFESSSNFSDLNKDQQLTISRIINRLQSSGMSNFDPGIINNYICDTIVILDSTKLDCWGDLLLNCTELEIALVHFQNSQKTVSTSKSYIGINSNFNNKIYIYNRTKYDGIMYEVSYIVTDSLVFIKNIEIISQS
jgi:hypothetical protein